MSAVAERTVTIEGETGGGIYSWKESMTPEEYSAWNIYADNHPWLLGWSYERTLKMFLFNFRMKVNLNQPLNK